MGLHHLSHSQSKRAWTTAHEAIKSDEALWESLAVDGIQGDGLGGLFEQRRCPACGSTLTRRTTAFDAVRLVSTLEQIQARSLEAIVAAGESARRRQRDMPPSDQF